jgi:hypothetical protein
MTDLLRSHGIDLDEYGSVFAHHLLTARAHTALHWWLTVCPRTSDWVWPPCALLDRPYSAWEPVAYHRESMPSPLELAGYYADTCEDSSTIFRASRLQRTSVPPRACVATSRRTSYATSRTSSCGYSYRRVEKSRPQNISGNRLCNVWLTGSACRRLIATLRAIGLAARSASRAGALTPDDALRAITRPVQSHLQYAHA